MMLKKGRKRGIIRYQINGDANENLHIHIQGNIWLGGEIKACHIVRKESYHGNVLRHGTLPDMYGKNLTFKTGGVDGCDCEETLKLIAEGKLNTEPLITHTYPLAKIDEAYELFENKRDGVIKVAVEC